MTLLPSGGPAIPVSVDTTRTVQGGAAIPVYGYTTAPTDGRPALAGPALPVRVLTAADLKENGGQWTVEGRPYALPVYTAPASVKVAGGPAIAVYPVNAWPPASESEDDSYPPGTTILAYDFNAGLGTWYSETDPDGDLNWSNDATAQAVAGTAGAIKVDILNTSDQWLTKTISPANTSGIWRVRFYLDPNSVAWPITAQSELMVLQSGAPAWGEVGIVKFGQSGGNYGITSFVQLDGGSYDTSGFNIITDAPHWIEFEVIKDTGSGNGRHRLWIDSLAAPIYDSGATLANATKAYNIEYLFFGVFGGTPYLAPGGSVYLDELIVKDGDAEIGPI